MTTTQKEKRLNELRLQASQMDVVPSGLSLQIKRLEQELGISSCNLDDGCLSCGS
jgi:hypothetical protein